MILYLKLFFEFFKTGLFSIGGGLATIPFLREMAAKTGWFTYSDLANMIAVSESTPGPLGINMATYIGFTTGSSQYGIPGGMLGAITATAGLVTPCIIVICLVAFFLTRFKNNKYVDAAFYGLRAASVGLISAAGISIVLIAFFNISSVYELKTVASINYKHLILAAVVLIFSRYVKKTKKLHPVFFIIFSAIAGIVFEFAA